MFYSLILLSLPLAPSSRGHIHVSTGRLDNHLSLADIPLILVDRFPFNNLAHSSDFLFAASPTHSSVQKNFQPQAGLMTSVPSQQQSPAQNSSSAAQSAAPVPAPSSSSGTSSQQAAAGRSFGNSVKRQGTSPNPAALAHGRSESISQSNGKASILPAVPTLGGPTIVNGNNAVSPVSQQPEHSRKSSVTISATGASGQMPNGGPVAGKPGIGNGIQVQFGSMTAGTSPSLNNSAPLMGPNSGSLAVASSPNPRVSSPAQSPSPIPQPAASGGRPPSSLYPQGNGPSFGSIGDDSVSLPRDISEIR